MKTVRKLILLLILPLALTAAGSGLVRVRNFSRDAYAGGPQNWAVTFDSIGRIYVGNRDGMLSCDGERWEAYQMPNNTTVRSLYHDGPSNRIYCGATEEFGYFTTNPQNGRLSYVSLLPTLSGCKPTDFTEVWNVLKEADIIWFQCDNAMLRYDGRTTRAVRSPERILCSAIMDGEIYVGTETGRILRLTQKGLIRLNDSPALTGNRIRAILPFDNSLLIATELNGLFLYDGHTASPLESDINAFLKNNQLFCATTDGGNYLFGTVTGGAVVKNFNTGSTKYINKESGVQNNTVLNAAFDPSGNLWLCLDNGLDYALYNSPTTNIIGSSSNVGAGYSSLLMGNSMYFGTNQGLFSTAYPFRSTPTPIALHRELQGQIWTITPISNDSFFIGSDAGAYFYNPSGFHKIEGLTGTYCIRMLSGSATTAFASCYDGFHRLKLEGSRWVATKLPENYPPVKGQFEIDSSNSIWISHWLKGVYRVRFTADASKVRSVSLYSDKNGLPSSRNNSVTILRGRPVVVNEEGFYTLTADESKFVRNPLLNKIFEGRQPLKLYVNGDKMVMIDKGGIEEASLVDGGTSTHRLAMARTISEGLVNGFEHISTMDNGHLLMANQNGFWDIDLTLPVDTAARPNPVVSHVYANGDSLVYRAHAGNSRLTLPYTLNSLRFEFADTDFSSNDGSSYSSFLEGYDDGWSPASTTSTREYTRLPEGRYTLHLRVVNPQTGCNGETAFEFEITPPWYRSMAAKIVYLILFIALVMGCGFCVRRWIHRAEQRMKRQKDHELETARKQAEQEALHKDYEIATLKSEQLEVDIKHKSNELSSATMNLIRKNEILNDIASKISKIQSQKALEPTVQKQLSHIQASIEQNISHDDDWTTFNRNFDIVYGGFTKRLQELHPRLSQSDMRLCCYIKMGLSSKDIAPLINISYKSV